MDIRSITYIRKKLQYINPDVPQVERQTTKEAKKERSNLALKHKKKKLFKFTRIK